jgi:hypothetical protein
MLARRVSTFGEQLHRLLSEGSRFLAVLSLRLIGQAFASAIYNVSRIG